MSHCWLASLMSLSKLELSMKLLLAALLLTLAATQSLAEELTTLKNVPYGTHPRQVMDFYPAKSDQPTPVVFYIHGGGWRGGDKKTNPKAFLDNGISVVAINYRYVQNAVQEEVVPPVTVVSQDRAVSAVKKVGSRMHLW